MFSGNPVSFCNYIFKAIDKAGKGIIDFATFLEVVPLLRKSDELDLVLKAVSGQRKNFFQKILFCVFRFSPSAIWMVRELLIVIKWRNS